MSMHWLTIRLGDVIQEKREPVGKLNGNSFPVLGVTNVEGVTQTGVEASEDRSKYLRLRPGYFVYNPYRVNVGSLGVSSETQDGIVSPAYVVFAPTERINHKFLYYFLKSPRGTQLINFYGNRGSVRSALRFSDLCQIEISLPQVEEQRRIVARIEELSSKVQEARALRQEAFEETSSLLSAASARLFEPKIGWSVMSIGEFCEHPQYGYTESASNEAIGPHFLRITDIQNGQVDWSRVPYCHCPDPSKYLLKLGDLIFARTGATTGKSFLIQHCPEAVFASYLIRLRVREKVSVDYLYHYFQSPGYWDQITDKKIGTGQPNLNGSKLGKLMVPVPPLDEQNRIVAESAELNAKVNELKRLQAETAVELDALLPSILDRAFKGEL